MHSKAKGTLPEEAPLPSWCTIDGGRRSRSGQILAGVIGIAACPKRIYSCEAHKAFRPAETMSAPLKLSPMRC